MAIDVRKRSEMILKIIVTLADGETPVRVVHMKRLYILLMYKVCKIDGKE